MINFINKLFKGAEEPVATWNDPVLGDVQWDSEANVWWGQYSGLRFSLAKGKSSEPEASLVAYVTEIFQDPSIINNSMIQGRSEATRSHAGHLKGEIEALQVQQMAFYKEAKTCYMHLSLGPSPEGRVWRTLFTEFEFNGITFEK